jgi:hypothetical protein
MKKRIVIIVLLLASALIAYNAISAGGGRISLNQPAPFPENI